MDILNPEGVWIETRCYRLLPIRDSVKVYEEDIEPIQSNYIEDEAEDPNLVIMHVGNKFYTTIHCPGALLRHVNGKSGKMKLALEQRHSSRIKIPPFKEPDAGITIFGESKAAVSNTYYQIMDIINTSRLREEFTHFVSFPINSSEIQASYKKFREDILSKYNKTIRIDASIFQKPSKLHVTVSPLVLFDERDKLHAEAVLKRSIESVLEDFDKEIVVQVKGIEYMNDDPAEVDILYAKLHEIDGDNSLQVIADKVMTEFVKEKLAKDQHEKVKLHITLMNTKFRSSTDEDGTQERITFDARSILKEYEDYDFGQITISDVHISVLHTECKSSGYYLASCKIKLKQT